VGGVDLKTSAFDGTIESVGGVITSAVSVNLGDLPNVVPAWKQSETLSIGYSAGAFTADVKVRSSNGDNKLSMYGKLDTDGTYRLDVSGAIIFAGSPIKLTGNYTSGGYNGASNPRWSISGSGNDGSIDGVKVIAPKIAMSDAQPGVTGTARLLIDPADAVVLAVGLSFVNDSNWSLSVNDATPNTWKPILIPGLTVQSGGIRGKVENRQDGTVWDLRSDMSLVTGSLTTTGAFVINGPRAWNINVSSASGSILGASGSVAFDSASGTLSIIAGAVSGSFSVVTNQPLLVDTPSGWVTRTELGIAFNNSSGTVVTTRTASSALTKGSSTIQLDGTFTGSAFELRASGRIAIGKGALPVSGVYQSAGFVSDGVVRAEPYWDIVGNVEQSIDIGKGTSFSAGSLRLSTRVPYTYAAFAHQVGSFSVRQAFGGDLSIASTTTFSGSMKVQITPTTTATVNGTITYSDEENWNFTVVAAPTSDVWVPFSGLRIYTNTFHGTAASVAGQVSYNMTIDTVTWTNMATGVNLSTSFSIGDDCPLPENCPSNPDGIFVGFTNGALDFPSPIADMLLSGAFLNTGEWARFDAASGNLSYNGISISSPTLSIWKGERTDEFDPDLKMPNLSSSTNGFSMEFCGNYKVSIADIATVNTGGCIEWTPNGVVMGQVGGGGNVTSGSSNGVTIGNTTIDGFAWTDLTSSPTIELGDQELELGANQNTITATMSIPSNVMHAVGAGDSAGSIAANGWFTTAGDFSLDGNIVVSLKSSGFILESISVHIGKDGRSFSLGLGAEATVSISGNHFPVSAFVGVDVGGGSSDIVVRLSIQGAVSKTTAGTFDVPTLLPTGNFEPTLPSLVDGSFDAKVPKGLIDDPDFENAVATDNLMSNADFERNVDNNIFVKGDFEDGAFGSTFTNGSFDDGNMLVNGDFEDTTNAWWASSSQYVFSTVSGDSSSGEEGGSVLQVTNTGSSAMNAGVVQDVDVQLPNASQWTYSVWARTADNSQGRVGLYARQFGTGNGCASSGDAGPNQTFNIDGNWKKLTLNFTGACKSTTYVYLNPLDYNKAVQFDAASLSLVSSPVAVNLPKKITTQNRPMAIEEFNVNPTIVGSSDVYVTNDYGNPGNSLRSDGNDAWWTSNDDFGSINGNFDLSYDIYFPASSSRDISNFGFWLKDNQVNTNGYAFRVQSANGNGSDSGFWTVSNGFLGSRLTSMTSFNPLPRSTWYTIRLTGVGSTVNVEITNTADGSQYFSGSINLPSGSRAGWFGHIEDNQQASVGHRLDNLTLYSTDSTGSPQVRFDPSNAYDGNQYLFFNVQAPWTMRWSTQEVPVQGDTYTFDAWVRSRGGTVNGELQLDTAGGNYESNVRSFSVGNSWTHIVAQLKINQGAHSDLRVSLRNLTGTGTELDIDGANLRQIPGSVWIVGPGDNSGDVTVPSDGSATHSGTSGTRFLDRTANSPGSYIYQSLGTPSVGATYTLTAWVKGIQPNQFALNLVADGGSVSSESDGTDNVTSTSQWTMLTRTLRVNNSGHSALKVKLTNLNGGEIAIDDVQVTSVMADVAQDSAELWTASTSGLRYLADSTKAHSGSGFMQYTTPSGTASGRVQRTLSGTGLNGNTYTASVWVRAATGTATGVLNLSSGSQTVSTPQFTANGNWQLVTVNLPLTSATSNFTISIDVKTSNIGFMIDDAGVQLVGLSQKNPWRVDNGSGITTVAVMADQYTAHTGKNYLVVQSKTSSGKAILTLNPMSPAPTKNQYYTFSAWVRSNSGEPISASIGIETIGGTYQNRFVGFTATGTWQHVFVTMPISSTGITGLAPQFYMNTLGKNLTIDGVDLRLVSGFVPWGTNTAGGPNVNLLTVNDPSRAVSGGSYQVMSSVNSASSGMNYWLPTTVTAGSVYTMQAYVRSTTGANISGGINLSGTGTSNDGIGTNFTATSDWQFVTVTLVASKSNTYLVPQIDLHQAGSLDIDSVTLTQQVITQADPWRNYVGSGGSVSWKIMNDPTRAHDSNGALQLTTTGTSASGVEHTIAEAPTQGSTYVGSAWVRSLVASPTKPVSGAFTLYTNGGATMDWRATNFTLQDTNWHMVPIRVPMANSGHTSMGARITLTTPGVTVDIDDVQVQKDSGWTMFGDQSAMPTQTQMNDSQNSQSGSGYLRINKTTSVAGGVQYDTTGNYSTGTSQTVTMYLKSAGTTNTTAHVVLSGVGVSPNDSISSGTITLTPAWKKVTVTLPITKVGQTAIRTQVFADSTTTGVDIDSMQIGQEPLGRPDGVTTPLPNPQTGYVYLWDDAFGIPGAHLWNLTAQVQFTPRGLPGLGVGATIYLDPTKLPKLMVGTAWLKGDMALNISRTDPCFSFGFDGGNSGTKISIKDGLFTSPTFKLSFAPKGCEILPYVVPQGAAVTFDATLGDASLHFDLQIGRDANNSPTFYQQMAVNNLKLAGTTYNTMSMTMNLTAQSSQVSFVGDFTTKLGGFYGAFDLSMTNLGKIHMDGEVNVTDWKLVGGTTSSSSGPSSSGTIAVSRFHYTQVIDIDPSPGACSDFSATTDGDLTLGSRRYTWTNGQIAFKCGVLDVLHFELAYSHRAISSSFLIDYNNSTRVLAGGLNFKFERRTSWKYFGHRYSRHPKMAISLAFSMNVDKPSTATMTLKGSVSVSGGSGSLACSFGGSSDDECTIDVSINVFGGHRYRDTW
jgi:hypothetical protein